MSQSRSAGRNNEAHRFNDGKASFNEPGASGTAQQRRQNEILCRPQGGLGFLLPATHG